MLLILIYSRSDKHKNETIKNLEKMCVIISSDSGREKASGAQQQVPQQRRLPWAVVYKNSNWCLEELQGKKSPVEHTIIEKFMKEMMDFTALFFNCLCILC